MTRVGCSTALFNSQFNIRGIHDEGCEGWSYIILRSSRKTEHSPRGPIQSEHEGRKNGTEVDRLRMERAFDPFVVTPSMVHAGTMILE